MEEIRKIKASRSVYDTWKKFQAERSEDTSKDAWVKTANPYNVYDYAYFVFKQVTGKSHDKETCIRVVTIDEEYEEWLEYEGRKDSIESRHNYKNLLSIEDIDRLLIKNRMNRAYYPLYLPFTVESDGKGFVKTSGTLTDETRDSIKRSMEVFFGSDTIYSLGCFVTPEEAKTLDIKLQMMACAYFENGISLPLTPKITDPAEYDAAVVFVPLVYSAPCMSADVNYDAILHTHPEWVDPSDVDLHNEIVYEDMLQDLIDEDLGGSVYAGNTIAIGKSIEDVYKEAQEALCLRLKTQGRKIKNA